MDENLAHRYLNEGFSGGEKKCNDSTNEIITT